MVDYLAKFELYLEKLKRLDVSRVFTQNISFPEFLNLKIIDVHSKKSDDKSVRVSDLVENSGVSAQAVSKSLKILESKNYITRFPNKVDRRITQVEMTKFGKKVHDITQSEIRNVMDKVFSEFSDEECGIFDVLVSKFLSLYEKNIDKMTIGE